MLVQWYRCTMDVVATNIRFPSDEYEQLKTLAFLEKKPISKIIRDSVKMYKSQVSATDRKKLDLFKLMVKSRVKINVPTSELVSDGRRI